ncbi:MAG: hypothetical protein ACR2MK_08535, partial [Solirubrobacteraceae bacterium]
RHPFFVASQYHPEFKSRPERPAPLFREFVGAALEHAESTPGTGGAPETPDAPETSAHGRAPAGGGRDVTVSRGGG